MTRDDTSIACGGDCTRHRASLRVRFHGRSSRILSSLTLTASRCSVIATVSGDGLVYEVFNGLAARSDARRALKIPVAPIPTGTSEPLLLIIDAPRRLGQLVVHQPFRCPRHLQHPPSMPQYHQR